ncbi:MAG: DUF938 domain-containing protein [Alphaproteobacteria bacterium]|nr:DUF938 domain-containing protein [Alphaproteobacteria bacterium]
MFAAADRNKDVILDVLRDVLPSTGTVLEIASGGGQHVFHFSAALPDLDWCPSDYDLDLVGHLQQRIKMATRPNLLAPLHLDVREAGWSGKVAGRLAAVTSSNLIHIAPWSACMGLFDGAARVLEPGGLVYFYGPFIVDGKFSSDGNESFDRSLRADNPDCGLRHLEDLCEVAKNAGFVLDQTIEMPVNNLSVLFRRVADYHS